EFEIGHSNLLATMIAPPHEFDLPCRFMIGGLANEQMLGWPVAPNAAALLRRIHLRKELLHTCEHESIEGTFRHCIASASVAAAAVKPKAIRSVFMTSLVLAHQMRAPVTHKRARGSCTERPARPAHRDAYP